MKNTVIEKVGAFERILTIIPPYDLRNIDPKKNYGIHGMELRMVLRKNNNCTQFVAHLAIYLPHIRDMLCEKGSYDMFEGSGYDVGYHSEKPRYENQLQMVCNLLEGGKCYYGGSTLMAQEWYEIFLKEGMDKIWDMLEEKWIDMFSKNREE